MEKIMESQFSNTNLSGNLLGAFQRQSSTAHNSFNSSMNLPGNFSISNGFGNLYNVPSLRRVGSLNTSTNMTTNVYNSNVVNDIKIIKGNSIIGSQRVFQQYGSRPFGASVNTGIVPIDERQETNNSTSTKKNDISMSRNTSNADDDLPKPISYTIDEPSHKNKHKKGLKKKHSSNFYHPGETSNHKHKDDFRKKSPKKNPQDESSIDIKSNKDSYVTPPHITESLEETFDEKGNPKPESRSKNHSESIYEPPNFIKVESAPTMKRFDTDRSAKNLVIMVGLFSDPLVHINKLKAIKKAEEYSPVDFEGELSDLSDLFEKTDPRKFSLKLAPLNMDNFRKAVERSPAIIHIMCHGDFDKQQQYFLDFEHENAEVFAFYPADVDRYLANVKDVSTALVFLNACYSEQLVEYFLNHNVKCVVAIDKYSKIDDRVSRDFARKFYKFLLSNTPLQKAFENTVTDLSIIYSRDQESYFSYCSHVHKPNCQWKDDKYYDLLHLMLECPCPNKYRNLHLPSCLVVGNFQMDLWSETLGESLNMNQKEILLCCCSPELPHEEILKFKIFFKESKYGHMTLSDLGSDKSYPKAYNDFDHNKIKNRFLNVHSIGFNFYMYQLFNYFVQERGPTAIVCGPRGSGKTTLLKNFANYCYRRNKFLDIQYKDFTGIQAFEELVSKINQWLTRNRNSTPQQHNHDGKRRDTSKKLYLLDNLDDLFEKNADRLKKELFGYKTQNVSFLISLTKSTNGTFSLENKEVLLKPLSYYAGAKLFINKARPRLPNKFKNYNSLIYFEDFEKVQDYMVFYPENLISLALRVNEDSFNREGMKEIIDSMNKKTSVSEIGEKGTETYKMIEEDLNDHLFIVFLGFLSSGAYFTEDLTNYAYQNKSSEANEMIKFILNEVVDKHKLSLDLMEPYDCARKSKMSDFNHTPEAFIDKFTIIKNLIIDSRFKDTDKIQARTLNIELVHIRDDENVLLFRTKDVRSYLRKHFNRRIFHELLYAINFLIYKANCLVSYSQRNYLIAEDTYFTAFSEYQMTPFFSDPNLESSSHSERLLANFLKANFLNMKSILDDSMLVTKYFNYIKDDDKNVSESLLIFEQFVLKFFSIAEMESLSRSYFDIEVDFKNLVQLTKMDEHFAIPLTGLYLKLYLFSLNSMLKRNFIEKYSYDYYNRINSRISLIKSIFREAHLKNNEASFRLYKLEFYYLEIRALRKLAKGKIRSTNQRNTKGDEKIAKLLEKLRLGIQSLNTGQHGHFLTKVYLMIAKKKYKDNNLDMSTLLNLEYNHDSLQEISNLNLAVRAYLMLTLIYNDWGNKILRDLNLKKAMDIYDSVQNPIYEARINRIVHGLQTGRIQPKLQFLFTVSSYTEQAPTDSSQSEALDQDKIKEIFLGITRDQECRPSNFIFESLNLSSLQYLLSLDINYTIFCCYFNTVSKEYMYFNGCDDSTKFELITTQQFLELLKHRRAQIETLIILNPIFDKDFLNQICVEIPFTVFIEKYELENIMSPSEEKDILKFLVLNFVKQFIARIVYENQQSIVNIFSQSIKVLYDSLDALVSHNRSLVGDSGEEKGEDMADEELSASILKSSFKIQMFWDKETPFFEKLLEAIYQVPAVINIKDVDDFGTVFRLKSQKDYPVGNIMEAFCQRRFFVDCGNFESSKSLDDWLLKSLQAYDSFRKRNKRKIKDDGACDFTKNSLQTIILYDLPYSIDPFMSETLAKLIIRLKLSILIFNCNELSLQSPYIISTKQINLPKQDFNLMLFDHKSEENVKEAQNVVKRLAKVITGSVFFISEEDEEEDLDTSFSHGAKKIKLSKEDSFLNTEEQ